MGWISRQHALPLLTKVFAHSFKSVRFLLVDSKVPRDTKSLVAGVGKLKEQVSSHPTLVASIC